MPTHFLHIRKTGGTAIKHALAPVAYRYSIVLHEHDTRLSDIPVGHKLFFVLRDPIQRYVSGFNSRLRKGQPHNFMEWRPEEAKAFGVFQTPNSLAEALTASDDTLRLQAEDAMRSIRHVAATYKEWFDNYAEIDQRKDDVLLIGIQEELGLDFERLKRLLKLPPVLQLPSDAFSSHATPAGFDKHLSELAVENLRRWYADDIQLYERCLELRRDQIAATA